MRPSTFANPSPVSRRRATARGTVVNGAFLTGLQTLTLIKSFVAAAFIAASDYGVWGLLILGIGALTLLKQGLGDKFIQQDEHDEAVAFQHAFTFELTANLVVMALMLAALPVLGLITGEWAVLAPGVVFAAALPAMALKAPIWIFYRRMHFARQRTVEAVEPIVALLVTVGLAIAGAGYWSLVAGYFAGAWAVAAVAVAVSPYPLRIRFDRRVARSYFEFAWPVVVANGGVMLIPSLLIVVGQEVVGLAGAGLITLAGSIASYTDRVDAMITETLYPAICRVRDRADLLREAFVKSNRLDLMWGVPLGIGIALFAKDLIDFGLGDEWRAGLVLIQVFALTSAANHIGYNWAAFLRATGDTRPLAIAGPIVVATFLLVTLPLFVAFKLDGLAAGIAAMTGVSLIVRAHFVRRLFPTLSLARQGARGLAPVLPGLLVTLALRAAAPGPRTLTHALLEFLVFLFVTAASTLIAERRLLRELVGYLRRAEVPASSAPVH